jgi:hypothetical protein
MQDQSDAFWKKIALQDMSVEQWESLCDGCAKCCLIKLQDEETDEVAYTNVVCRYMDENSCRCTEYQERNRLVPNCVWLKPEMVEEFFWLPETCAYRLVAEKTDLPAWHYLISGSRETVHEAEASVKHKSINESHVHEDDLEDYIVHWVQ